MMPSSSEIRIYLKKMIDKKYQLAILEHEQSNEQGATNSTDSGISIGSTDSHIDNGDENDTEKSELLLAAEKWIRDKGNDVEDYKNQLLIELYLDDLKKQKQHKERIQENYDQKKQVTKKPNYQYQGN